MSSGSEDVTHNFCSIDTDHLLPIGSPEEPLVHLHSWHRRAIHIVVPLVVVIRRPNVLGISLVWVYMLYYDSVVKSE